MLNNLSVPVSVTPFDAYPDGTRVFVIHPTFNQAKQLLSRLITDGCYLRLQGSALAITALDAQLEAALRLQTAPVASVRLLIIDEADRADGAALVEFIGQSLHALHPKARIVIFSREMPTAVLRDRRLRETTALYPVRGDSATPLNVSRTADGASGQHTLEVHAFGIGRVMLDERLVADWDGALPRALFFFMVDRGIMTRNEIFSIFWPELSVSAATNVFHVTKRKMTDVLGIQLSQYSGGFYHLASNIVLVYDVSTFIELVSQAESSSAERALPLLQQAISLYRNGYLSMIQGEWIESRRAHLHRIYVDALIMLGRLHQEGGDAGRALSLFMRVISQQEAREDIVLEVMSLYIALGEPDQALHTYERLVAELERTTKAQPGSAIQALAETLMSTR